MRKTLVWLGVAAAAFAPLAFGADYVQDWEKNQDGWKSVDEPGGIMGDAAPGKWVAEKSAQLDGFALHQTANTWGDKKDIYPLGTYYLYDLAEYNDFILECDIYAQDNDGWGFLFRYTDRTKHYRFLTMIDPGNPEFAPADMKGPWSRFDVRLGDEEPYYELLGKLSRDTYRDNVRQHVKLEVTGSTFKAFIDGKLVAEASDPKNANPVGKIGLVCFAQNNMWFDNIQIASVDLAVDPTGKTAAAWARIKSE